MPAKKRDYRAEYARRKALAQERGFSGYAAQRKAIERGKYPAIAPHRVRTKRTSDAQAKLGLFGRNIKAMRIEAAQVWSDRNARANTMKFDAERARTDEDYLSTYLGATVMMTGRTEMDESTLIPSDDLRHLLVDVLEVFDLDEYDQKYGEL